MLILDMSNESDVCLIDNMSFESADVAHVLLIFVDVGIKLSHLCEFIDDYSCEEVVEDGGDEDELQIDICLKHVITGSLVD